MNLQISYHALNRLNLGGNYTLGELKGNVEARTAAAVPSRTPSSVTRVLRPPLELHRG